MTAYLRETKDMHGMAGSGSWASFWADKNCVVTMCATTVQGEEILTPLAASAQELIRSWSSLTYSTGNEADRIAGAFSMQPSVTTDFFLISTVMSSYYCSSISAVSFFIRIFFF